MNNNKLNKRVFALYVKSNTPVTIKPEKKHLFMLRALNQFLLN